MPKSLGNSIFLIIQVIYKDKLESYSSTPQDHSPRENLTPRADKQAQQGDRSDDAEIKRSASTISLQRLQFHSCQPSFHSPEGAAGTPQIPKCL